MPEKCNECPFADNGTKFCILRKARIINGKRRTKRMPLCPLINEGEYLTRTIKCIKLKKGEKNET